VSKGRCPKGVKDFFCSDITPGGGREIVSGKRKVNGKRKKIMEKEDMLDRTISVEDSSKELLCVAGSNYF